MKVNLPSLRNKLQNNVCEIIFEKRRPKPGDSIQRRMLCTLDESLLNSVNGRTTLNYKIHFLNISMKIFIRCQQMKKEHIWVHEI